MPATYDLLWSAFTLLMPVVVLAGVVGLVVLVVRLAGRRPPAPSYAAEAARRHGLVVNVIAWMGVVLAPVPVLLILYLYPWLATSAEAGDWYHPVLAALYPAGIGLQYLAVHAIGELTWPRPTGRRRRAALSTRRRRDVVPTWIHRVTWGWAGLIVAVLVATGATARPDGRSVAVPYASNAVVTGAPYPGWDFGVPLLVATALLLAATEAVLRLVARRPAVVDTDPDYDAASRRLSAHRVLRGTQLVLALTATGVLTVTAVTLLDLGHAVGAVLVGLAVLVGCAGVAVAVVPARAPVTATPPAPVPAAGDAGRR